MKKMQLWEIEYTINFEETHNVSLYGTLKDCLQWVEKQPDSVLVTSCRASNVAPATERKILNANFKA